MSNRGKGLQAFFDNCGATLKSLSTVIISQRARKKLHQNPTHSYREWQAHDTLRKILSVLPDFQLFKYARHFTVLPGREDQETIVVLKGENGIDGCLRQLLAQCFQTGVCLEQRCLLSFQKSHLLY